MQKDILLKAAVLTIIAFVAGISIGIWLDLSRVEVAKGRLTEIDLQWNDARLQSLFYQTITESEFCNAAIAANLEFNDRIYKEGQVIEQYELVNRFAPQLIKQKQRYALLQLQFWLNSIALKERCNASYTTLVYFYSHYNESATMEQRLQSAVLADLKEKCGNRVLLIPLPYDLNIATVDMIKDAYNITQTPSILINESLLLSGLQSLPSLEEHIRC